VSFYAAGVAQSHGAGPRYRRFHGAGVGENTFGPFDVRMPGAIRDEILSIDRAFRSLANVISAARGQGALPANFLAGWDQFFAEWSAFRLNHESWLSNVWYASYQKALEYRERLDQFRQKVEQLTGAKLNFPAAKATPGPTDKPGIPWRFLIISGVVIGGVYALSKVLGSAAELKREFPTRAAPSRLVVNPPAWVQDPDIWEQARLAVEPYRDRYDNPAAVTTHVYKQMGGRQALAAA
jgi:hypothetical protein